MASGDGDRIREVLERGTRELKEAKEELQHAIEQIEKMQYWNAMAATNKAMRALMGAFDSVLKSPNPAANPAYFRRCPECGLRVGPDGWCPDDGDGLACDDYDDEGSEPIGSEEL